MIYLIWSHLRIKDWQEVMEVGEEPVPSEFVYFELIEVNLHFKQLINHPGMQCDTVEALRLCYQWRRRRSFISSIRSRRRGNGLDPHGSYRVAIVHG